VILFICGTSSVGKSSVCHALKKFLGDKWLYFDMDGYLAMLGERLANLHHDSPDVCKKNEVVYAHKHENGSYEIVVGPLCTKLFSTIPEVLSILAKAGFNIIVDSLITKKIELHDFKSALKGYDCQFIFLDAPLEVINQREETRGDRLKGSAEHWLNSFDFQNECDFILDTSDKTPDDIKSYIIGYFNLSE
jgi:chloramphenicol 3-O-phosphotransferase